MPRRKEPEPLTFELSEVVAEFLADYESGPVRTHELYRYRLGLLTNWCDSRGISDIACVTDDVLRGLFAHESKRTYCRKDGVERTISPTSVVQLQSAVATFFTWAIAHGHLPGRSPMDLVRRVRQPVLAAEAFERDECTRLIREAGRADGWLAKRDRALVIFLLDTGARRGEVLKLTPKELDWPRRRVLLHGKGAKDRWVPIGRKATRALQDYLAVRPKVNVPNIFVTQRNTAMNGPAFDMMLRNLAKYSGVPDVHAHRFRHTYASEWYRQHRDILALKNLLGHTKVDMTQRYLRSLGLDYGTGNEYASPGDFM